MRICLIGLPRSGSQYISRMIATSYIKMSELSEPFTHNQRYSVANYSGKIRICPCEVNNSYGSYSDSIDHVSKVLASGDINQSVVLRLLLYSEVYPYLDDIILTLKKLNFTFIVINRENIEHQLLSYAIACASDKWNTDQGLHNDDTFDISDNEVEMMKILYRNIINFNSVVQNLNLDCKTIRYEHAVNDLTSILNKPINTHISISKQVVGDPYNMIRNAAEVKQIIKKIINGTEIY